MTSFRDLVRKEWLVFWLCCLVLVVFYFSLRVTGPLFLLAWFAAYVSFPVVRWLEKRGVRRSAAISICLLMVVCILTMVVALIGPWIFKEARQLVESLPSIVQWVSDRVSDLSAYISQRFNVRMDGMEDGLQRNWEERLKDLELADLENVKPVLSSGVDFFLFILQLALVPIFYIYLLFHFERIPQLIERIIPSETIETYRRYIRKFDHMILGYLQGLFVVSCFLAVAYSVGLSLSGVRFGAVIGVLAGLLSFIPYLGGLFGGIMAVLMTLIYGEGIGIWIGIALTFIIAQSIESYVLTPKVVGGKVGLHPLVVILLVIAGANVAGLAGMIISIPLGAMAWIIIDDLLAQKQKRERGDLPD